MEEILITSNRKPFSIENGRGKDFHNTLFQDLLNKNNIKYFSRSTYLGAVFAKRPNCTIRDFRKRHVFEKKSNWIVITPTITKRY